MKKDTIFMIHVKDKFLKDRAGVDQFISWITFWGKAAGPVLNFLLEAVEFLLGERKTEEAVYLARRHHNLHLAGRIHEALFEDREEKP